MHAYFPVSSIPYSLALNLKVTFPLRINVFTSGQVFQADSIVYSYINPCLSEATHFMYIK